MMVNFEIAVVSICKRLKDQVMFLAAPIRGIAPMLTAIRKLQLSTEHLTTLHPDFLLLCLSAKCYKNGLSILEDDIYEVDQPRDLLLYGYYGWVSFVKRFFHKVMNSHLYWLIRGLICWLLNCTFYSNQVEVTKEMFNK